MGFVIPYLKDIPTSVLVTLSLITLLFKNLLVLGFQGDQTQNSLPTGRVRDNPDCKKLEVIEISCLDPKWLADCPQICSRYLTSVAVIPRTTTTSLTTSKPFSIQRLLTPTSLMTFGVGILLAYLSVPIICICCSRRMSSRVIGLDRHPYLPSNYTYYDRDHKHAHRLFGVESPMSSQNSPGPGSFQEQMAADKMMHSSLQYQPLLYHSPHQGSRTSIAAPRTGNRINVPIYMRPSLSPVSAANNMQLLPYNPHQQTTALSSSGPRQSLF